MRVPELSKTGAESDLREGLSTAIPPALEILRPHLFRIPGSQAANWFLGEIATFNSGPPVYRGREKRQTFRFATHYAAILQRLNPLSVETTNVFVVDVSAGGLRLHVPAAIMVGSFCKVKTGDRIVFGPVRYCIPSATGFFAGIRLDECVAQRSPDREKEGFRNIPLKAAG